MFALPRFAADGELLGIGSDGRDQIIRAASYVIRILNGKRSEDLPIQAPVKCELAINLKTRKALGLSQPATLLARADQVIE